MLNKARDILYIGQKNGVKELIYKVDVHIRVNMAANANRRYNHWKNGQNYNADGFHIFDEDWDNLIVLDACRFDAFSRVNTQNHILQNRP